MSHTLRPRANCIRKALRYSKRSISSSNPSRLPETEAIQDEEEAAHFPTSIPTPTSFLSTRSEVDAYLRAQDDAYLASLERHLKSLSRTANTINTILPELNRRSALIRPPSNSASQIEKATIPPYTVAQWKDKAEMILPTTNSLIQQIERVLKNIEDLQGEPYRADVSPSQREKLNKKVADWSVEEKTKELMNAELLKTGMEARFARGVEQLDNGVTEMLAARQEKAFKSSRREAPSDSGHGPSTSTISAGGSAMSYRPLVSDPAATSPAAGMDIPKTAGWGMSATKAEERGKHNARTPNPFVQKPTVPPRNKSKNEMEAIKRKLDTGTESQPPPQDTLTTKTKEEVSRPRSESEAPPQAKSPPRSLADLQRRMNVLQEGKESSQ